ncbi:MAG: A/G-specific adenine glycosylase [Clostridiales bacterium]|nr:A/G-specific adenine glycosylase [Clostridiales bacterium]
MSEWTEFASALLRWYHKNKRDLPWRGTADPYAIWISEIMAQQTRITALLPYYQKFMDLFPCVEDLAAAPEESVLKAWEGLGYYARARNLRKAARLIVEQHQGKLPADKQALLALPGVGAYTAGAILAIAYGIPEPAVDGNVLRVFARMENSAAPVDLPETRECAATFVRENMPADQASAFTQALMELGALICLPKQPLCGECPGGGYPTAALCQARRLGLEKKLPHRLPKPEKKICEKIVFLIISPSGGILCRKRTENLLRGLWEFYVIEAPGNCPSDHSDSRPDNCPDNCPELARVLREAGFHPLGEPTAAGEREHVFTHLIWRMQGWICFAADEKPPDALTDYVFLSREALTQVPVASALAFYRGVALAVLSQPVN